MPNPGKSSPKGAGGSESTRVRCDSYDHLTIVRRPSLRQWVEALQWRALGNEWKIGTAFVLAALAALVALWPRWTLDYLHVLAWPAVVLIGLLLFRWPIYALLRDTALEEGGFGPVNFRFRQRQDDDQTLTTALLETTQVVEGLQAQVDQNALGLSMSGVLIQIYEVQIGFLRHLQTAEPPVTAAAAEGWFETQTRAAVDAGARLDIPALVGWLNGRGVIALNERGVYGLTDLGAGVLWLADNFGYAPKVL
jgi:hypothetical protein